MIGLNPTALAAIASLCLPSAATAHDASHSHADWYSKQTINEAAVERLGIGYKSCCDAGDHFKTRFRVAADNSDQWQYLKDGVWKVIPPDIISRTRTHPTICRCCSSTGTTKIPRGVTRGGHFGSDRSQARHGAQTARRRPPAARRRRNQRRAARRPSRVRASAEARNSFVSCDEGPPHTAGLLLFKE